MEIIACSCVSLSLVIYIDVSLLVNKPLLNSKRNISYWNFSEDMYLSNYFYWLVESWSQLIQIFRGSVATMDDVDQSKWAKWPTGRVETFSNFFVFEIGTGKHTNLPYYITSVTFLFHKVLCFHMKFNLLVSQSEPVVLEGHWHV